MLSEDALDTIAALTTTLVLLDQTDGRHDLHIKRERVVHNLLDGLRALVVLAGVVCVHDCVDQELLLLHGLGLRLGLIIGSFLLFLLAGLLLLFLLSRVALHLLLKGQFNLDLVVLFEVAGHRDLNDRGIVFQVKKELVEVDIDGLGSRIENAQVLLHLANTSHGGLQYALDE